MKIVLFLKPDFVSESNREIEWIHSFSRELSALGASVDHFIPHEHKLKNYDLVHVFSVVEPEIWHGLNIIVGRVVVTPSLSEFPPQAKSPVAGILLKSMNFLRKHLSKPQAGAGGFHDYRTADRYLVVNSRWKDFLRSRWGVESNQAILIESDPARAARAAFDVYTELVNSK